MTAKRPSRMWQVFSGPDEMEHLPDDGHRSAWSYPAQVRLPMEHWEAILAFAQGLVPEDAAWLADVSILDGATLDAPGEARLMTLLEALAKAVVDADPLTPEHTDPALIPEPMPNTEHAAMLRDILRLVRRARSHGMTVDSWAE